MKNKDSIGHEKKASAVQAQVAMFFARKQKARIYHGSTTSTRSQERKPGEVIDVSDLNQILTISVEKSYADVEPNVPMDRLVRETLKHGLIPAVVPELPAITVGGSVQGGAGESSSFKWGCFHEICTNYEVILGNGTLINASVSQNTDLFYGMPCSYGSIGIVTKIRLQLIPATKYINLTYEKVTSFDEALQAIKSHVMNSPDFLDAIMFDSSNGVVMTGYYSDDKLSTTMTTRGAGDDWFYIHAKKVVSAAQEHTESMPLEDYLFRYDKGAFWVAKNGFEMFHIPFTKFTRTVFSGALKNRTMYTFLNAAKLSQKYLVQDVCIPKEKVHIVLSNFDKNYTIYPLWLCPLKPDTMYPMSPSYLKTDLVVNIGIWGKLASDYDSFQEKHAKFENFIRDVGGRKVLYGHVYESEDKFWSAYDKPSYEQLRSKYESETTLPSIYKKVFVAERYQPSALRGFKAVIQSIIKK